MTTSRPQTHVFIATSLDGFIARPDGNLDWLTKAQENVPAGEDFGFDAFMAGMDALVMGRKTLETVMDFDPWPYAGKPVHVLTRQLDWKLPDAFDARADVHHDGAIALLGRLGERGIRNVYLDGGELIQSCLLEDVVDTLTLTTVPILLGQGRPLWGKLVSDLGLQLEHVQHWSCGFVQCRYLRAR